MANRKLANLVVDTESSDGRRKRSERTRARIVEAVLDLVGDGNFDPSAADVAAVAGVGLRTVFRHFEDKDSLYREMSAIIEAELAPVLAKPFEATDWRDRLFELLARRTDIYERILPFKVASGIRRFQSKFLMDAYRRFLAIEHSGLEEVLPPEIRKDEALFSAIEMVLGFQTWRRLRHDQGLSSDTARAVMRLVIERLIKS